MTNLRALVLRVQFITVRKGTVVNGTCIVAGHFFRHFSCHNRYQIPVPYPVLYAEFEMLGTRYG